MPYTKKGVLPNGVAESIADPIMIAYNKSSDKINLYGTLLCEKYLFDRGWKDEYQPIRNIAHDIKDDEFP